MAQSKNPNYLEEGRQIRMNSIRRSEDIQAIKQMFFGTPKYLLPFTMGINNGLRTGDLLKLKVRDVKSLKSVEFITLKENKTGKQNILIIKASAHKALKDYLQKVRPSNDD